jgi:endonuclease/exonuclease/phosphatase family metal-dependent hydrolase
MPEVAGTCCGGNVERALVSAFRVATYNIRHGLGTDGAVDLARVASVLLATGAELIALQEIDRNLERSGRVDQPAMLTRLTGLPVVFHPVLERGKGHYGIALAGEGLADVELAVLPHTADEQRRGAIVASWRGLKVVATHLATQPDARAVQIEKLAGTVAELGVASLYLGDFNTDVRGLEPMLGAGLDPGPGVHPTFRHLLRRRQIDYVLAGPGLRVVRSWTMETNASDHLPLVAEVERVAGS